MLTDIAQIWSVANPFVAAGLASWITYRLSLKQRRAELAIGEQLAAFKVLQGALVGLIHYCDFMASRGRDIGPGLPDNVPGTALSQAQHISQCMNANRIFMSSVARHGLSNLCDSVAMVASMELAVRDDPTLEDLSIYTRIRDSAEQCIDKLYGELGLSGRHKKCRCPNPERRKHSHSVAVP